MLPADAAAQDDRTVVAEDEKELAEDLLAVLHAFLDTAANLKIRLGVAAVLEVAVTDLTVKRYMGQDDAGPGVRRHRAEFGVEVVVVVEGEAEAGDVVVKEL